MQSWYQTCTGTYSGFQSFQTAGAQKKHPHTSEQMCPPHCPHPTDPDGRSFHQLFLEAWTSLLGIGEFARVTSQVGFRESEVNHFCHPQLVAPERADPTKPSNNSQSVSNTNRENACICKQIWVNKHYIWWQVVTNADATLKKKILNFFFLLPRFTSLCIFMIRS